MKILAQKSLKTKLRLKCYESLNFQGLKHKITELKIDFLLKLGTKFEFITSSGGFVQNCRI
jgi:hypothetical protein